MARSIWYLIILLCSCQQLLAQDITIEGVVVDATTKEPLRSITILLKDNNNKIVAYKTTDASGIFKMMISKDISTTYLEINHLGYKKVRMDNFSTTDKNKISLEVSTVLLDEIQIKSRPRIKQNGDTLSYDVSSFAKEEDRSIGDVLKRMPGIEVSESGQIKYQGKSISNFYIDGDDLLGSKYRIGTNTITHNMVKDVQVLNNHEHMKVLKNKRYTDEVALNLVIKDEAKLKLSGQAKIGAGLPKQYDSEVNTILFNKKYKGLNVLQANNVGRDLSSEVKGFNSSSIMTKLGMSPINNLLSLGTVGNPPLPRQHYFFNNSVAINANNLFNTKKKWQIVSNIQALFDKNNKEYEGQTQYFSENNTYSFSEKQESDTKQWLASISLKATKNEEKKYIENDFSFEYEDDISNAAITSNSSLYTLHKKHTISGFKNALSYVPAFKNGHILQVGWVLNYGSKPQTLTINPGVFASILNDNNPYTESVQHVNVPTFFTHVNAGYRLPSGIIGQYYQLSASIDDQKLKSHISTGDRGILSIVDNDSTKNNMHWSRSAFAFQGTYEYKTSRFSSRLVLPITYQMTSYSDPLYELDKSQKKILFNPNFSARYFVDKESEMSFSYGRGNSFGNIENVYRGLIIKNYRSISNNSAGINEVISNDFKLNYKTGKTIKLLFYNVGINYKKSTSSTMLSNRITNEVSQTELIEQENSIQSYGVNGGFDKYLFGLSSTLKLNATVEWTDYNQLFNEELLPFQNISYTVGPALELKIWRKLNLSYSGSLSLVQTKQVDGTGELDRNIVNGSQNIGFPFTIFSNFHFRISGRHLYSHQKGLQDINYLFLDTFIRYRYKKWNSDFELNMSNLGNIKRFDTYAVSANMESQNSYQLRGRMALLKMIVNF